jgi:hypothetical protein
MGAAGSRFFREAVTSELDEEGLLVGLEWLRL